jgi:hypothetical protein
VFGKPDARMAGSVRACGNDPTANTNRLQASVIISGSQRWPSPVRKPSLEIRTPNLVAIVHLQDWSHPVLVAVCGSVSAFLKR